MPPKSKNDHALNLFITYDLKKSLQELADHYDTTLANVVRLLLRAGLPLLAGLRRSQEVLLDEQLIDFRSESGAKADGVEKPIATNDSSS